MKPSNLPIGARMGLGFAVVLSFLVIVAVMGLQRMAQIHDHLKTITEVNDVEARLATSMQVAIYERSTAVRNVILLTKVEEMQAEVDQIKKQDQNYKDAEVSLSKMFSADEGTIPEEKSLLEKISAQKLIVAPLVNKVVELGFANKNEEATAFLMKEVRLPQRQLLNQLGELIALEAKLIEKATLQSAQAYSNARVVMIGISLLAIALGAMIAWLTTRSITRPINSAVKIAQTVASGDLTSQITVNTSDETGQLLQALSDMNSSLVKIVGEVRIGTETIATASSQIASGNMDLSSRTEEQAASLEETASSMEELTATVRQNSDNAKQANQLAASASGIAVKGGDVVGQVVNTMNSINDSAKKIVDIIGVIDGIAFQTNILALNAAVEAARAGEQGRGFAVVASEVRSLAQRSAAAAKEIKTLIGNSVEQVEAGSKLVSQARTTMDEIVESVKRVTDIMSEIAAASDEQSAGIEQVNTAIGQMDQVTQQNAALVEEAAAAAESLQEQASNLAEVVSVFKVQEAGSGQRANPIRSHAGASSNSRAVVRVAAPRKTAVAARKSNVAPLTPAPATDDEWQQF